jgi:ABC-2 type transport system permease protein
VWAVLRREVQEISKSRGLLLAIFLPPIFITVIPLIGVGVLGQVLTSEPELAGSAEDLGQLLQTMPELRSWTAGEATVFIILQQFLTFFLLMPLIIPMSIAAQSIVGEKQTKSLEPLLATPIRTGELLFGKAIAAVLPAILATWAAFILFFAIGRALIPSDRVFAALFTPKWLVAMLVLAPLLSLLSVSLAIIISSRVNDTRAVQQIGGFIVLPVVILGVAQTTGLIFVSTLTFLVGALIVAALDVVVLRIGVRVFQREKILTQWK